MATPTWNIDPKSQMTFGAGGRIVTPANADLDPPCKAVVMGATGDITVVPLNTTTPLPFTGVPAGWSPPFIVRRVTACSVACYTVD